MKFKFLTIFLSIVVALAFTSCNDKKSKDSDNNDSSKSDKSKSEKVEADEPTGDPEEDAEALADLAIEMIRDAETEDDLDDAEEKWEEILDKYEKYYKEEGKDELKDFKKALNKIEDKIDREYNKAKKRIRKSSDDDDYASASASSGGYDDGGYDYEDVTSGPTGDIARDARMAIEEVIEYMENAEFNSEADVDKFEKEIKAIQDKYENFYRSRGELQKFKNEFNKLENDPALKARAEKALEVMTQKVMKYVK